jgi:hypothetical protein
MLIIPGDYTPGSQGFNEWGGGCSCHHGCQPDPGAILDAGLLASWHAVRGGQVCFSFLHFHLVPYSLGDMTKTSLKGTSAYSHTYSLGVGSQL